MKIACSLLGLVLLAASCDRARGRDDGGAGNGDGGSGELSAACKAALADHSYIGCDYWPTVTPNPVWSIFDYSVVVANTGGATAQIAVSGPNGYSTSTAVPPGQLQKLFLPWVPALKGPDFNSCSHLDTIPTASITQAGGAYHLTSTQPVTVYQFSALEYAGKGGENKDWSNCPGTTGCGGAYGCYSYSNDASLLLPTSVLTGTYRVTGLHGSNGGGFGTTPGMANYFAVTGTKDGTTVVVRLSTTATVVAGGTVQAGKPGDTLSFPLDAGDVAVVMSDAYYTVDLSGSLVKANQPVQVIAGSPCMDNPGTANACDHIEESVFPAETLGKDYVVTVPTGPHGKPVGHTVRIYGNVDGTNLTYSAAPQGAPQTIDAGKVVELTMVTDDFEVSGDHEFAVGSFMWGGSLVDPMTQTGMQEGDPSQSHVVPVEQYRADYVFLAPDDYDTNYVDVVAPAGALLTLDGAPVVVTPSTISGSSFQTVRVLLSTQTGGVHHLSSPMPVGLQVLGYGMYTSYQYPGGLDLFSIAPPPG